MLGSSSSVEEVAKRTLGVQDESQVPELYKKALQSLLVTNPHDTNFRLHLGKEDSRKGGYGIVHCLDAYCQNDVILDPDPRTSLTDQRTIGFGSLMNYKLHCLDPKHVKGRRERGVSAPMHQQSINISPKGYEVVDVKPSLTSLSSRSPLTSTSTISTHSSRPKKNPFTSLLSVLDRIDGARSGSPTESNDIKPTHGGAASSAHHDRDSRQPSRLTSRRSIGSARSPPHIRSPVKLGTKSHPMVVRDGDKTDDDDDISILDFKAPKHRITVKNEPRPRTQSQIAEDPDIVELATKPRQPLDLTRSRSSASARTERSSLAEIKPLNSFVNGGPGSGPVPDQSPQLEKPSPKEIRGRYESEYRLLQRKAMEVPHLNVYLAGRIDQLRTLINFNRVSSWIPPPNVIQVLVPEIGTMLQGFKIAAPSATPAVSSAADLKPVLKSESHGHNAKYEVPKRELDVGVGIAGPSRPLSRQDIINPWQDLVAPLNMPGTYQPGPYLPEDLAAPLHHDIDDFYLDHIQGRPDDLQAFFSSALNSFDDDQDVDKALQYLGLSDMQQRFRALAVPLMPHQVLGVQFMLQQEKKASMRGGILADAMGLGKTLSSIATIVGNPSTDRLVKTTLVVAPLALLQQWKSEIETRTTTEMKVLIYWGQKRTSRPAEMKRYDVVLTTYGILASENGREGKAKAGKRKKKRDAEDDSDSGAEDVVIPAKQGPLFKIRWYRVILDEAHIIRNRRTRAAMAAFELHAELRWCLSGTPIVNSLVDVFSLLHFTGISPQREWKSFHAHIARFEKRRPNLATKRAQAILKPCTMRRNKDSTLNGVRLLNLPEKITNWDELTLDTEERHIYDSIEKRMQVKFNSLLKRGTVLKHYSMVLVMLIRLKQATCHPWLLTRRPEDAAHPEDVVISDEELMGSRDAALVDDMAELQRALDLVGQEFIDRVTTKLEDRNRADGDKLDIECAICFEPFEHEHDERITKCMHSFCKACTDDLFNSPVRTADLSEAQQAEGMRQCPMCRSALNRKETFRASAFFNPEEASDGQAKASPSSSGKRPRADEDEDVKPDCKKRVSAKGKGKAVAKDEPDALPTEDQKVEVNVDELVIKPSTKMRQLLSVIEEKLQDPTCKVVAYSQFTSYLDLCGSFLRSRGIANLQYQGSLGAAERQQVLDRFNTPVDQEGGDCRVLLLSLKAGGVGLNLTIANVVVALDLAWNAATEDQAVDRCHRIGQVKPVDVRRLVIENTIDERIRALQDTKRQLADGALGEGTGGKLGRLSVNDLIRLFNVDGTGEDV